MHCFNPPVAILEQILKLSLDFLRVANTRVCTLFDSRVVERCSRLLKNVPAGYKATVMPMMKYSV